jgi:hypothetical protein
VSVAAVQWWLLSQTTCCSVLCYAVLCCIMQGQIPKVLDDIVALQPTMFCGVPRVFDRIHAGIYEQVRPTATDRALTAAQCLCCLHCRLHSALHSLGAGCSRQFLAAWSWLLCKQQESLLRHSALHSCNSKLHSWCLLLLQLQHSPIRWFIFQACVWLKSFWMKRGMKHDKVSWQLVLHVTPCHPTAVQ